MADTDTKAKPEEKTSGDAKSQKADLDEKMKGVVDTDKPKGKSAQRIKASNSKKTTAKKNNAKTTAKAGSSKKDDKPVLARDIDPTTDRVKVPVKRHFMEVLEEIPGFVDIVYGRREPTRDELKRLRNLGDKIYRWARKLEEKPQLLAEARLKQKTEEAEAKKEKAVH